MSGTIFSRGNVRGVRVSSSLPVMKGHKRKRGDSNASMPFAWQHMIGNRGVHRLIQAKLRIGKPGDRYEQEADRIADLVTRMPEPGINRQPTWVSSGDSACREEEEIQTKPLANQITPLVQRQVEEEEEEEEESVQTKPLDGAITSILQRQIEPEEEEEEEPIQAKLMNGHVLPTPIFHDSSREGEESFVQREEEDLEEEEETLQAEGVNASAGKASPGIGFSLNSLNGSGRPPSESVRRYFEPRFGCDFSGVRIHTDSKAAEVAKSINAKAFTIRNNIFFNTGQFAPETSTGKRLLGHELTHVVQQRNRLPAGVRRNSINHQKNNLESSLFRKRSGSRSVRRPAKVRIRVYKRGSGLSSRLIFRLFDFRINKFMLRPEHIALLRRISRYIKKKQILVFILGHTSRSGPADANKRLSFRRALRTGAYLVNYGVSPYQIRAQGKGESDAAKRGVPDGRETKYDRAVEVVIFLNVRIPIPKSKKPTPRLTPRLYLSRKYWDRLFKAGLNFCSMQIGLRGAGIAMICAFVDARICIALRATPDRHLPKNLQKLKKACCTISSAPSRTTISKRLHKCTVWYVFSKLRKNPRNKGINHKLILQEVIRQYRLYRKRLLKRRYGVP